ncbi:MAG: lysophospholipid acyltransferase family protein [Elusimicrobia bacterium]|nr:lysophospholipid acyltransferase family protein [Elusimicrobiota bacterium]
MIRTIGRILPPTIRSGAAWHIGCFLTGLHRRSRWAVAQNLLQITGQGEPAGVPLLKQVGGHFACYLTDFLCGDDTERARLIATAGQEARSRFEQAVPHGRGAMVVTAHLGHWELGAELIAHWGYPVTVVFQPHPSPTVERLFAAARSPWIRWVPVGAQAAWAAWQALKAGQVVATAADRLWGDASISVSLCGAPARLPRGPFALAARGGVPLVCAFVLRTEKSMPGRNRYVGIVEPPLVPSGQGPQAIQELANGFAAILERYLQRYPEQWYVFEPFWNIRGVG